MTQASLLKITANGSTTSPVLRGNWYLSRILGDPPPPPPSGIPALEPDIRGSTSLRDLLARHRSDTSCARCHDAMDPVGMAFEGFDVMGGWRDRYRTAEGTGQPVDRWVRGQPVKYGWGADVEPYGDLPGGGHFEGIRDFKRLMLTRQEQVAGSLMERLVTYATGSKPSFSDRRWIREVSRELVESGKGLRTLIREVVLSERF